MQRAWLAPQVRQAHGKRAGLVFVGAAVTCSTLRAACVARPLHLNPVCHHRALNPARAVAATLLRYQQTATSEGQAEGSAGREEDAGLPTGGEVQVLAVEHFSREPQDW